MGGVFGYRLGRKGGGLYAVRFEKGSTLLLTTRVAKVAKGHDGAGPAAGSDHPAGVPS